MSTAAEAINREPQRMTTGVPAAPTLTDHSTAFPGGGASIKFMAVASPTFQPSRSPKQHENRGIDPKHEDMLKTSIAVPPALFRGCHFRALSSHPRDPESESFLASAAREKKVAGGGAHATTHAVALVYSRRCLSAGRCVTCCVIPISSNKNKNNTWGL